tara:strand:+ start:8747 stop:8920 length:174 start_codon:yes stop_codon:yes gene_type:complete
MTVSFGNTLDLKRIADSLERIAIALEEGAHVNIDHAHIDDIEHNHVEGDINNHPKQW